MWFLFSVASRFGFCCEDTIIKKKKHPTTTAQMMSGKHFKAHEVSCCIKYFIFGFNIIFWVSAVLFSGPQAWAHSPITHTAIFCCTFLCFVPADTDGFILLLIISLSFPVCVCVHLLPLSPSASPFVCVESEGEGRWGGSWACSCLHGWRCHFSTGNLSRSFSLLSDDALLWSPSSFFFCCFTHVIHQYLVLGYFVWFESSSARIIWVIV